MEKAPQKNKNNKNNKNDNNKNNNNNNKIATIRKNADSLLIKGKIYFPFFLSALPTSTRHTKQQHFRAPSQPAIFAQRQVRHGTA
jgi:hypothetical protein